MIYGTGSISLVVNGCIVGFDVDFILDGFDSVFVALMVGSVEIILPWV